MSIPLPHLKQREINNHLYSLALEQGFGPLSAHILAGRAVPSLTAIRPGLRSLDSPWDLPDIQPAVERISRAVLNGESIGILSDHDADGVSAHAVLFQAFLDFGVPHERLCSFIGHRLNEGYGLSSGLCERILAHYKAHGKPTLLITADHGSSDEKRIAILHAHGIDTIVTDHHVLPEEGPPASALACINPQSESSHYPDRAIAGCMVAWLLICAVRSHLSDQKSWFASNPPDVKSYLDWVAVGTVADCVSLATSINNRAVVRYGLERINSPDGRPCWKALRMMRVLHEASSQDLAFKVAPMINAHGRLDDAMAGVQFLRANDINTARQHAGLLKKMNQQRRQIQEKMLEDALEQAQLALSLGARGLMLWLEHGHAGVQGIVAGRIAEAYGVPVACLSPSVRDKTLLTGSVRAGSGHPIHIRDLLQQMEERQPGLWHSFGGHAGAAGCSLLASDRINAQQLFDQIVREDMHQHHTVPGAVIQTDGPFFARNELNPEHWSMHLREITAIGPYGREFEAPLWQDVFRIIKMEPLGAKSRHLQLQLRPASGDQTLEAMWFDNPTAANPAETLRIDQHADLAYQLEWDERKRKPRLIVRHLTSVNPASSS